MMTHEEALVELLAIRQGLIDLRDRAGPAEPLEALRPFLTRAGHAFVTLGEPLVGELCLAHGAGHAGSTEAAAAFWKLDLVTLFADAVAASERAGERQASTQP